MFAPAGRVSRAQDLKQLGSVLRCGASVMALCAFAAASPAMAQSATVQGSAAAQGSSAGDVQNTDSADAPETRVADST